MFLVKSDLRMMLLKCLQSFAPTLRPVSELTVPPGTLGHMLDAVKHPTESGATPVLKPTGSSSGEINDVHEVV